MKRLLLLFCFGTTHQLWADQKPKEPAKVGVSIEELRKIQSHLQDYQFLSLDFEQIIYKKLRNKTLKNRGRAFFKKPESFRWQFKHPEQEEWIFDGQSLLNFYPQKGYAHRYKAHAAKGKNLRELVNMVLNFDGLLKRYNVVSSSREGKQIFLALQPRERNEIVSVDLILDLDNNFIQQVKLGFEGGNQSTFAFSNPKYIPGQDQVFNLPSTIKITDAI